MDDGLPEPMSVFPSKYRGRLSQPAHDKRGGGSRHGHGPQLAVSTGRDLISLPTAASALHTSPTRTPEAAMIGPVLQFADLQELCRPGERPRLATVEAWARSQNILYRYDGKGGIWTTVDALNHALGLDLSGSLAPYPDDIM